MDESKYILFCVVYGENVPFSVKIQPTDTVDDLKDLIKEKRRNDFHNVDANKLTLWGVSIHDDDEEEIKAIELKEDTKKDIQKLRPTRTINKVFTKEPAEDHIHVIVERPSATDSPEVVKLRDQLEALQDKILRPDYAFDLFIGRRRTPFSWLVDIRTVTLEQLKIVIFERYELDSEFNTKGTSFDFVAKGANITYSPRDDAELRAMLRNAVDKDIFSFSVQLVTPSKAFSSYNLNTVCDLYDLGDPVLTSFPILDCGRISSDGYDRELARLVATLEEHHQTMPFDGMNEATRSIYVYFILHAAISIFGTSAFRILPQKMISGVHGHGVVDYAIDSCRTRRTVGVTEVKQEKFNAGIAQNAVQLEACLTTRKRKASEIVDADESDDNAFGVISDGEKFYFMKCKINGDGKPSFELSKPVVISYDTSYMKPTVADVLGKIGWLLEEAERTTSSNGPTKRRRTISNGNAKHSDTT